MRSLQWLANRFRRRNPGFQHDEEGEGNELGDINCYLPLYRAALNGDWESANEILSTINPEVLTAKITADGETALHVAVGTGKANHFVRRMVELMTTDTLGIMDINGDTALATAAIVGNLEAAKILVDKNQFLPYIWSRRAKSPLHRAAQYGQREMVLYLLSITKDSVGRNPYDGKYGFSLLKFVIVAGFYDVALALVNRYPVLAKLEDFKDDSPLTVIAGKPSAFPSGNCLNFPQRLVYFCVPLKLVTIHLQPEENQIDVENQNHPQVPEERSCLDGILRVIGHSYAKLWDAIGYFVPQIKQIQETKSMNHQALQLVQRIIADVARLKYEVVEELLKRPLHLGATLGIHELVKGIVESFPAAIWFTHEDCDVFQQAVLNRRENVFSLIYHMSDYRHLVTKYKDKDNNNILHLAGNLAPSHRLSLVSGAALQMQRELQWFKEVEKFVEPAYKEMKNKKGKTPEMVFTDTHMELVIEGEKWMKGTASSCTLAASLIATVMFTASISVPGGNIDTGIRTFTPKRAFIIFAISDAASLFSAIASVLMFLSILTSRYAHKDFLYDLPKRLIIGLLTLFLSITSMMIAFSAILYLVIGHGKKWGLIPFAAVASLPVTLFVFLQFSLLWKMMYSTYGRSIFTKPSKHIIY